MRYEHQDAASAQAATNETSPSREERPVIAITGGTQGLGRALAERLLTSGFAVGICARTPDAVQETMEHLTTFGPITGQAGDVTDAVFRQRFIKHVVERFGRLDGLVNNASTLGDIPLPQVVNLTTTNLRAVYETNVIAPVALVQTALPCIKRAAPAVFVGISSDAAVGGYPCWGGYGSSKAAADLLYQSLANELAESPDFSQTAVYTVDPGDMATAMRERAIPGDTGLAAPDDVAAAMVPLFAWLLDSETHFPYPSGTRFMVRHGTSLAPAAQVEEGVVS